MMKNDHALQALLKFENTTAYSDKFKRLIN